MSFLLRFHRLQITLESIEARFPDVAIALRPLRNFFQRAGVNPARPPLRLSSSRNQAGAFEHAEVLRDGWHAHVERLGQLCDRAFPGGKTREDRSARRIGEGCERRAQLIGWHVLNL